MYLYLFYFFNILISFALFVLNDKSAGTVIAVIYVHVCVDFVVYVRDPPYVVYF